MVSDLKTFAHKGWKIAAAKEVFYGFFLLFTPFRSLFAPTSQSLMSKLFRFSESLEKSNGKKWSWIWQLLLIKGVKSPRKKKLFLWQILPYYQDFLVSVILSAAVKSCFVSHMRYFQNIFRNPTRVILLAQFSISNNNPISKVWASMQGQERKSWCREIVCTLGVPSLKPQN